MNKLHFTQEQVKKILTDYIEEKEGVINDVLKIALEAMMRSERQIHNEEKLDMSNGYRPRKTLGQGKILELRVPRTRHGHFYPVILSLLKDQEEESRKIAFMLYGAGLTTEQVGEVFGEIYGRHYSSSQVSRLFDYAREEVKAWIERPLASYYPIVMIDACFIATRRVDSVSKEAYYTILGVKADRTREVLAIVNIPTESSLGWKEVFSMIRTRGVKQIDLVISDGLTEIEQAILYHYPQAEIQLCTVHLERNIQKYAKPQHKAQIAADFKEVFKTGDKTHTVAKAEQAWKSFCSKWGRYYPSIGKKIGDPRIKLYFTYLKYDYRIQTMLHTTNWIERLHRDYKRTTRIRGALPNADATILLLGYVAMNRKAFQRKIPLLDYEKEKFNWEE